MWQDVTKWSTVVYPFENPATVAMWLEKCVGPNSLVLHGHMHNDNFTLLRRLTPSLLFVLQVAYQKNVVGSLSELQLLGRACASDLSEHIQVRGAFDSVSRWMACPPWTRRFRRKMVARKLEGRRYSSYLCLYLFPPSTQGAVSG